MYDDRSFQALKALADQWPESIAEFNETMARPHIVRSEMERGRAREDFLTRAVGGMREAAVAGREKVAQQAIYALGVPTPHQARLDVETVRNLLEINRGWSIAGVRLAAVLGSPKGEERALTLLRELLTSALQDRDAHTAAAIVLEAPGLFRSTLGAKAGEAAEAAIGDCLARAPSEDVRRAFAAKLEADRGAARLLADVAAVEAAVVSGAKRVTVHTWAGEPRELPLPQPAGALAGVA